MLTDFDKRTAPAYAVNLAIVALVVIANRFLPPEVPMLYGLPVGSEQLVPKTWLMLPALVSLGVSVGNSVLARVVKSTFLETVLLGLIYAVTTLSTITIVKIFLLVGPF